MVLRESWSSSVAVHVVKVRFGEASKVSSQEVLFQAAGWLRADPYPTWVTALSNGVVDELFVEEGQSVEKGQLLATLDDDDARLDLERAKADLAVERQKLERAKLEVIQTELHSVEIHADLKAQQAILERLEKRVQRLKASGHGVSELELEDQGFRYQEESAVLEKLHAQHQMHINHLEQAEQQVLITGAMVAGREVALQRAQLMLDRTRILAPIDGVIEELYARVGRKQMLGSDSPVSTTVAKLYQPDHLLAEIDVPLQDIFDVKVGQSAIVRIDGYEDGSFGGVVSRIAGEADPQKNTTIVRVQLRDPDPRLRPGMLAQVQFMGTEAQSDSTPGNSDEMASLLLPSSAIVDGRVASVDSERRIRWKNVETQSSASDGWVRARAGIQAGELLVDRPQPDLLEGQKVTFQVQP